MEEKYAVMRATIDNRDQLIVQKIIIAEGVSQKNARFRLMQEVKQRVNTTLTWIGWVDCWTEYRPQTIR